MGYAVPVGWGQTRRGWIVTAKAPDSRAFSGALIFSKEFADIGWGMYRCLGRLEAGARDKEAHPAAVMPISG